MRIDGKKILLRAAFFIGWLLSPFTSWNDAFVNIPISYVLASVFARSAGVEFIKLVLVFYWLTNAAGVVLMYISGRKIFEHKKGILFESIKLFLTIAVYSIMLVLVNRTGLLKSVTFVR